MKWDEPVAIEMDNQTKIRYLMEALDSSEMMVENLKKTVKHQAALIRHYVGNYKEPSKWERVTVPGSDLEAQRGHTW